MRAILTAALLSVTAAACETDSGYVPYVPAPGFEEAMEVTLELPDSTGAGVGEFITLHASRRSGPWSHRCFRGSSPAIPVWKHTPSGPPEASGSSLPPGSCARSGGGG